MNSKIISVPKKHLYQYPKHYTLQHESNSDPLKISPDDASCLFQAENYISCSD